MPPRLPFHSARPPSDSPRPPFDPPRQPFNPSPRRKPGDPLSRRAIFSLPALALAQSATPIPREVFQRAPGKGTAVMAYAFYTRKTGGHMTSIEQRWSRSDTIDIAYIRHSTDHGKTWSQPIEQKTGERVANGMLRRHPRAGWVDPRTGRYIEFWMEGVLPSDDPLEGMRQWNLFHRISKNGKPLAPAAPVVHEGPEFSATHPLPHVFIGKNCVMLGDLGSVPVCAPDGSILVPLEIPPLDANGNPYNPTGGYTYTDCALLLGRWRGDRLTWSLSEYLKGDPARSTRGLVEPTIEFLDDGRLLMVMRGSNDKNHRLPAYRWVSFSHDGGRHWQPAKPWTYSTGEPFFSPSSCSQLIKHSSGRLFWLGNIVPVNPKGNRPRYPFVIGEVDRKSGLLIKESVRTVDDRQPGENEILTLSNFYAREDRLTRDIALHMTRLFALSDGWEGDAMLYRIPV